MDTWKRIGFYLTVYSLWISFNQAIQLCQNEVITTGSRNLNMDSSPISGTNGMCSCQISLDVDVTITMFAVDINSPGCNTNIVLSDTSYTFPCMNGRIAPVTSYIKDFTAGQSVWVFVTSTGGLQAMSGILQIKSKPSGSQFTLECFEQNTNTTVTTPMPTTTTTTTTTSTSTSTSTTTTLPTTSTLPTDITTTPMPVPPPQQPSTTSSIKTSSQQPQTTTTAPKSTAQTDADTTSGTGSNISTTGSTPTSSSGSAGVGAGVDDDDTDFPVAAVVGGIIGGLALIIIIIVIAVCLRKRSKEQALLESGPKTSKGLNNTAYDNGVPHIRNHIPKHSIYASTPITMENDLYVSADSGHRSKDAPNNSLPLENDNDLVGGSEVVVTSSGDIYAIVDKSNPERNPNVSPSGDSYTPVNKSKKPNVTFKTDTGDHSGASDVYATVNKSRSDLDEEDEEAAINRMMKVPDEVLQDRISSVQSTAL